MADKTPLKPLPYYKWFWQDFRANRTVQRMSYVERGLYRELLDECWVEGSIPDSIELMADICGCPVDVMTDAWQVLSKCFVLLDGRLHNEKMDSMRTEKDHERVARQVAGRKGGSAKSLNSNDSEASASKCLAKEDVCHIEEKEKRTRREEKKTRPSDSKVDQQNVIKTSDLFNRFWQAYPRKVAKAAAEKAFAKVRPDQQLLETILSSLEVSRKSPGWLKDNGQFIPHAATWLNGRRWEDNVTPIQTQRTRIMLSAGAKP
jgi:uncharacterized protein YdaU (DUF1376 family)